MIPISLEALSDVLSGRCMRMILPLDANITILKIEGTHAELQVASSTTPLEVGIGTSGSCL
jgi:hypothetical protein